MNNFDLRFLGMPNAQNMLAAQPNMMPVNMLMIGQTPQPAIDMTATGAIPSKETIPKGGIMAALENQTSAPVASGANDAGYFPPAPDANRAPITQQDYQASLSHLQSPQAAQQQAPSPAQSSSQSGGLDMGTAAAFLQGLGRGNGLLSAIGGGLGAVEERKQGNQTVNLLMARGVPEAEAQIVARNPQAAIQVLQNLQKGADPKSMLELQKLGYEVDAARLRAQGGGGDPFTLGEGQVRYDGQGKPIAFGGQKNDAPSIVELYDADVGQPYKATWNPATQTFDRIGGVKAPSGTQLSVGADGQITFQQGSGLKPLTEGQSKDAVFATRAEGSLGTLNQYGNALAGFQDRMAGGVPVVGNYLKSEGYQKAEQAGQEFLQAILRKDTGAAITKEETDQYGAVYLPRPGDGAAVLQQKAASRQRALEALKAGMPPQAILQAETALKNTDAAYPSIPAGVDQSIWNVMTPEERALWSK